MNISVCITVFNEEESIGGLLDSLLIQTKKPDAIVVVDGGSTDKTVEIIRHYQKRDGRIKLLVEKCSRARGRNLACEIAKDGIIAITDAGCTAHEDWLEKIVDPFQNPEVDISAGFYKMIGENAMQKAMSVYLGVLPSKFDINFLPSTRSMAFRKRVWEEIGGFPGEEKNSAEDTYFNFHALKLGMKYARVKSAVVEWGMPRTLVEFFQKIRSYAKWDAMTKIWLFPRKGITSHNIKALFVLLRYLLAIILFIFCAIHPPLLIYWIFGVFIYLLWTYRKVYIALGDKFAALFGPFVQITADLAVVFGFLSGFLLPGSAGQKEDG